MTVPEALPRAAWAVDIGPGDGPAPARRLPRLFALLLALGMAALLPLLLNRPPPTASRALPAPAGLVLALLPPAPAPLEASPARRPREARKAVVEPVAPGVLRAVPVPALTLPELPSVPGARANEPPAARPPDEPVSAPLRLDAQVLRRAARDSTGLARAAQVAAEEERAASSPQQALGQAIERTGRPDCIGPNAQGSLLTLPKLALDAMTGKCR